MIGRSTTATIVCLVFVSAAGAAQAACVADYKAKRDNPLELFFETAPISGPCTVANATAQLQSRLSSRGLTLLKVIAVREE